MARSARPQKRLRCGLYYEGMLSRGVQIAAELAADKKKMLEEQRQMGLTLLTVAYVAGFVCVCSSRGDDPRRCAIIVVAWCNGVVSWQFHYVAQRVFGLPRFPLPADVARFRALAWAKLLAKAGYRILEPLANATVVPAAQYDFGDAATHEL